MDEESVTGNHEEKAQAWIFWWIRYCTIHAALPFHPSERWMLGGCSLPHSIFLARYFVLTLEHISGTEKEENISELDFCLAHVCRPCDGHLDKFQHHLQEEKTFLTNCNLLKTFKPPWLWGSREQTQNVVSKKTPGPSVGKKGAMSKWSMKKSSKRQEMEGKKWIGTGLGGNLWADSHCLLRLTCSLWSPAKREPSVR